VSLLIALMLGSALGAAALDQAVKGAVTARLAVGRLYGWSRGVGLRLVANRRPGALPLSNRAAVAVWAGLLACLVSLVVVSPAQSTTAAVGLGLSLGGATGNLVDRLVRGAVVDFIALWRWPTFNLAEAAMVAGIGLVVVSLA